MRDTISVGARVSWRRDGQQRHYGHVVWQAPLTRSYVVKQDRTNVRVQLLASEITRECP